MPTCLKRLCPVGFPQTLYDVDAPQAQLLLALVRHQPEKLDQILPSLPSGLPVALEDIRTGYKAHLPLILLASPKAVSWRLKNFPMLEAWERISPLPWEELRATGAAGEVGTAGVVACMLAQSVAACRKQAWMQQEDDMLGNPHPRRSAPPVRAEEGFTDWGQRLDWTQPGPMGRTALHWLLAEAPLEGVLKIAQLLTEAGIDWQHTDEAGLSAAALYRRRTIAAEERVLYDAVALQIEGMALDRFTPPGSERARPRL